MTRFEFVNKLNGKLYLLSEEERRDIIDEYMGHIDMKMSEGKTEAQAIKDFGDIDELADDILRAYHIDSSKVQNKTLDIYIRQVVDYIGRAAEKFLSMSVKQIARVIAEFVLLMLLLRLMRWPITSCADMFVYLFMWAPDIIYAPLRSLIYFAADAVNVVLALILIYHFINKRIIDAQLTPPSARGFGSGSTDNGSTPSDSSSAQQFHTAETTKGENFGRMAARAGEKAGGTLVNFAIAVIKVMLILSFWLPSAVVMIGSIVCTVLACILYITTGIGFIGVCVGGIGVSLMSIAVFSLITDLLGGKKNA